jgi:CheY-like chemotaxis protein
MNNSLHTVKSIVLYADDDQEDLELVQDAFSRYSKNVQLIQCCDGLEALSYLKNISDSEPIPCLIILDINMPKMNGKEVLKQIRELERFKKAPIVMFTTSAMQSEKSVAEQYNAGFITKPIDQRQMEVIIKNFIDHCTEDIKKQITR